eukprot:gene7686-5391_t
MMRCATGAVPKRKDATLQLAAYCEEANSLDPSVLQQGIDNGAKLCCCVRGQPNTILGRVLRKGSVDCVRVCLSVAERLNFKVKDKHNRTTLHRLCERSSCAPLSEGEGETPRGRERDQEARRAKEPLTSAPTNGSDRVFQLDAREKEFMEILQMIVDRLRQHTSDAVDWEQKGDDGLDFLSYAAKKNLFLAAWRVLQRVPPFCRRPEGEAGGGTICVAAAISWREWAMLSDEERAPLFRLVPLQCCEEATAELMRVFESAKEHVTPEDVAETVAAYANVCEYSGDLDAFILSFALASGTEATVAALLRTPNVIDFNFSVQRICLRENDASARTLLGAVLHRLETHPEDILDWTCGRESDERSLVSYAAHVGSLARLWPVLRMFPPFASLIGQERNSSTSGGADGDEPTLAPTARPMRIATKLWAWDWDELVAVAAAFGDVGPPPEEGLKKIFQVDDVQTFYEEKRCTAVLWRCVLRTCEPDAAVVRRLVEEGANISFHPFNNSSTIFHRIMGDASIECVMACLETAHPIDFSLQDSVDCTVFHRLCHRSGPKEELRRILEVAVQRLEQRMDDGVDFSLVDSLWGLDFISMAAVEGLLPMFWPVLIDVPHYADNTDGIYLMRGISREDWEALGKENQQYFRDPSKKTTKTKQKPLPFTNRASPLKGCRIHAFLIFQIPHIHDGKGVVLRYASVLGLFFFAFLSECMEGFLKTVYVQLSFSSSPTRHATDTGRHMHGFASGVVPPLLIRRTASITPKDSTPLYVRFIQDHGADAAACFAACMESEAVEGIDFTWNDCDGRSPVHLILLQPCRAAATAMLQALLARVQTHFRDRIDWGARGGFERHTDEEDWGYDDVADGHDCLSFAAWRARLGLLYPLVKGEAHYADQTERIPVRVSVFPFDWESLAEADQRSLNCDRGLLDYDMALYRLSWDHADGFPELETLQRCVDAGGDVSFSRFGDEYTVFNRFLSESRVDHFQICLTTSNPIDFDIMDGEAMFTLIIIPRLPRETVALEMLKILLERLRPGSAYHNAGDTIDWGLENSVDYSFRSEAILAGRWSLFYPLVKDVPYFASHPELAPNEEADTASFDFVEVSAVVEMRRICSWPEIRFDSTDKVFLYERIIIPLGRCAAAASIGGGGESAFVSCVKEDGQCRRCFSRHCSLAQKDTDTGCPTPSFSLPLFCTCACTCVCVCVYTCMVLWMEAMIFSVFL